MKSWKCEFCERHVGPKKTSDTTCKICRYGSKFKIKAKMHHLDEIDFNRHCDLDKFVDSLGINLDRNNRELLHMYCSRVNSPPISCVYPKNHGRTFAKTNAMKAMEILQQGG